jgi:hypothetical protein
VQVTSVASQKRLPIKLALEWRQGIEATKFKTIPVPGRVLARLRPLLVSYEDPALAAADMATGALLRCTAAEALRSAGLGLSDEDGEAAVSHREKDQDPEALHAAVSSQCTELSTADMHTRAVEAIVASVSSQVCALNV